MPRNRFPLWLRFPALSADAPQHDLLGSKRVTCFAPFFRKTETHPFQILIPPFFFQAVRPPPPPHDPFSALRAGKEKGKDQYLEKICFISLSFQDKSPFGPEGRSAQ